MATVIITSLGGRRSGAGYSEMLKKALSTGSDGVLLRSSPINWWMDDLCVRRMVDTDGSPTSFLNWNTPGDDGQDLQWRAPDDGGQEMVFITGGSEISSGAPSPITNGSQIPVSGLPPNTLLIRAGDFLHLTEFSNPSNVQVVQVISDSWSSSNGVTQVRVTPTVTISSALVRLSAQDEAVFEVDGSMPRAVQNVQGDWSYTWRFREIFSEEVGGFSLVSAYWGNRFES